MKRPSFQFYPSDWRKDLGLSVCSLEAKGLWIELLCLMHESEEYGVLSANGQPITNAQISKLLAEDKRKICKLVAELLQFGICSVTDSGALYSRRMVRDEHIRNVRARAGQLGGNPKLLNKNSKDLLNQNSKQKPTPSSSSSSSSSIKDLISSNIDTLYAPKNMSASELKKAGINVNSADKIYLRWLKEAFGTQQIIDAINKARLYKKPDELIATRYIDKILRGQS